MNKKTIQRIFENLEKNNPNPKTELVYATPFELLISVMLSAQATDISVNKATEPLYKIANTAQGFLTLGENRLKEQIKTIGLFNTKAKNIIKTCEILVEKYQGNIPRTREELEALPGVGRKTANVILNTAFGELTIAVDTHVFRVSNRTGLAKGKTVLSVEEKLMHIVPTAYKKNAHHLLILHGRYICKARNPECHHCIIYNECEKNRN